MAKSKPSNSLKSLLGLKLPDDIDAIGALPDPDSSTFQGVSSGELVGVVEHFRQLWHQIVDEDPFDNDLQDKDYAQWQAKEGPFWKTLRMIGVYHGWALASCSADADLSDLLPLVRRPEFSPRENPDDASLPELIAELQRASAETALWSHLTCWVGLLIARRLDEIGFSPGELPDDHDPDLAALDALGFQRETQETYEGELLRLYLGVFRSALWARTEAVRRRARLRREASHSAAVETSSRELRLLAGRSPLMGKKYGVKKVEKVFEQQLALVFQSLGFTVIPALPGEAVADLLCISREARYCFLVDAKSSAKPYGFPKSDQRALGDYAKDFSIWLADLPELKFILVVGSSPGTTLEARLKKFETEIQKPVRFASARVIGEIRDQLPGPVIPEVFKTSILDSPHLLSEELPGKLKGASDGLADTYQIFVKQLKGISGQ
jgi:hypothetical protein